MIQSVGIDFSHGGAHKVRCLDQGAQLCDGFTFQTTPEGLALLEERLFNDGASPTIVFEPTGLAWLAVAVYLRTRHPNCRLVRAKGQKVAALRRYLRSSVKSDRIDALTLAKMPFINPEQLDELYLPPAELHTLQRLTRPRKCLETNITSRKNRIGSVVDGYLPGIRRAFTHSWSRPARAFLSCRLNPFSVVRAGEKALHLYLTQAKATGRVNEVESHLLYLTCQNIAALYDQPNSGELVNEAFFSDLQEEIGREFRLMEVEEAECEALSRRIEELYKKLSPTDNLRTIPGVGQHTAPVFLSVIGDPARFHSQSAFANWTGVVPGARQSSQVEAKGLRMTKAGPAIMKWALYQAGEIARRWDPQLASVYYNQMVNHGKNHKQAMGAVMSHLAARLLSVLREDKAYALRDTGGEPVSPEEAKRLILFNYQVPEDIRRQRRRHNRDTGGAGISRRKGRGMIHGINEAAVAPQPVATSTIP
jgi:transposase